MPPGKEQKIGPGRSPGLLELLFLFFVDVSWKFRGISMLRSKIMPVLSEPGRKSYTRFLFYKQHFYKQR